MSDRGTLSVTVTKWPEVFTAKRDPFKAGRVVIAATPAAAADGSPVDRRAAATTAARSTVALIVPNRSTAKESETALNSSIKLIPIAMVDAISEDPASPWSSSRLSTTGRSGILASLSNW